jgi:hypothetical protein
LAARWCKAKLGGSGYSGPQTITPVENDERAYGDEPVDCFVRIMSHCAPQSLGGEKTQVKRRKTIAQSPGHGT